ncbi:DDE-type integrase/transposase/recombinase [Nitrospira sp. Ecomares 2.1]
MAVSRRRDGLVPTGNCGWSMNLRMTQQPVCDALTMAVLRRGFPKGTIIHADRGIQYGSQRYRQLTGAMVCAEAWGAGPPEWYISNLLQECLMGKD